MSENPVTQPADDFDQMFESVPEEPVQSAGQTVTIRSTTGDARYVTVDGPTSLSEILRKSGLSVSPATQIWMDGVVMTDLNALVPAGASLTLVTSAKGG